MPNCRGCGAPIRYVKTERGRSMPVEVKPRRPDGRKLLVFPDGVTALTHLGFTYGYESHIPFCPERGRFAKKKPARAAPARVRGNLLFE